MSEERPHTSWALSMDRAEQRRRRTVGVVVLLGLAALMVLSFWKLQLNSASVEVLANQGAEHLEQAFAGDRDGWNRARDAFRQAAGRNPFDAYPVFCMATLDWFELLSRDPNAKPPTAGAALIWPMARQVAVKQDYSAARQALIALSVDAAPADQGRIDYFIRLVTALEVAHARRSKPPPS
ncbi:MAG: hypothetical protein AAFS10_03815 [Myxococcota bacterium]